MKKVDHKRCGTLPDFGNFGWRGKSTTATRASTELMPYAKGVSAKSHDFDDKGNETQTDYRKMMEIVLTTPATTATSASSTRAASSSEPEGIKATKKLLEKVREELAPKYTK